MTRFCVIVLFISQTALSQQIKRAITLKHVQVPGTTYFIIPPDTTFGFSKDFTGMQSMAEKAAINITELPVAYKTIIVDLFQKIPAKAVLFDSTYIGFGNTVRLIKTNQKNASLLANNDEKKIYWIQVSGNDSFTLIVSAAYELPADMELTQKIKKSLLSFVYDPAIVVNPLDQLSFFVNTEGTPLKFADIVMQTGVFFNSTGKSVLEVLDTLSFSVLVAPVRIPANEQKDFVKRRMDPLEEQKEMELRQIMIDGLPGYEVEKKVGGQTIEYNAFLFDQDRYFRFNGFSKAMKSTDLLMFRQVAGTFRRK
jgi:hypothetical protein